MIGSTDGIFRMLGLRISSRVSALRLIFFMLLGHVNATRTISVSPVHLEEEKDRIHKAYRKRRWVQLPQKSKYLSGGNADWTV